MKKILLMFCLLFSFFSCKQRTNENDLQSIKEKVQKSESYISYSNDMDEIKRLSLNRELSYKGADLDLIKRERAKAKTLPERIELYKRAGVIGGEKLAKLQFSADENFIKLLKENTELKNFTKEQVVDILMPKSTITNEDVNKAAARILESNK